MKKIVVSAVVLILIMCLTGCAYTESNFEINKDGSGKITTTIRVEKTKYDYMIETLSDIGSKADVKFFKDKNPQLVVIDEIEYYQIVEKHTFKSLEALEELLKDLYDNVYVSETGVRFVINEKPQIPYEDMEKIYREVEIDLKDSVKTGISFTMPKKIINYSEGGKLSQDGKTVTFTFDIETLSEPVDVMVSTAKEDEKPDINVTHKKTYRNAKTVTVSDASGIKSAQYKEKDGEYVPFNLSHTFAKNGTYAVTAKDYYGNTRTRTFTLKDESKPKVKGATDGRTYTSSRKLSFSDNCGISSVTLYKGSQKTRLSQKEISSGLKLTSSADYKIFIKDINGNSRIVKFTINK